jgi:hypothetical protein
MMKTNSDPDNMYVKKDGLLALKVIMDVYNGRSNSLMLLKSKPISEHVFRMSKEGKMLSLFCSFINYFPMEYRPYLEKRCKLTSLYLKYLKIISEELGNEGIEYYIFKTIKPFAYDMTDIDVLIVKKKDLLKASGILIKKLGFRIVSKGTYSLTFRKTVNGLDIDIDLQSRVSAGTFEYISISETKRIMDDIGYIRNGISLLRPELELVIITGHVFFKDLSVSLADLIYADLLIKIINEKDFITILEYNRHLIMPFGVMHYLTSVFKGNFSNDFQSRLPDKYSKKFMPLARHVLNRLKECGGRITIPLSLSIEVYLEVMSAYIRERHYKRLLEIIKLPQSRGVKLLFRRLGILPQEEAIRI